ncbi:hypothetical protein I4U23_018643 [Adineta vaga]|nr:hypothetical protein I4U23_018643 [Adineta vaga]
MVRLLGRCLPIICMSRKKRQFLPIGEQHNAGTKHHQEEINKLFARRVESIRVTQQGAICKRLPCQTLVERPQKQKKTKIKEGIQHHEKIIKPDDTEFDCETHISDRRSTLKTRVKSKKKSITSKKEKEKNNSSSHPGTPVEKPLSKAKKTKSPSPTPSSIVDIPEEDDLDATDSSISSSSSSLSSEWSTTTYPDSQSSEQSEDLIVNPIQRRQSMPLANLPDRNDDIKHRSCVESFYLGREHVRASSSPSQTKTSLSKIKDEQKKLKSSQTNKRNEVKPTGKSKQVLQNVRKMMKDQSIQEQHFNDTRQRESVRL